MKITEYIKDHFLFLDGGMGTMLQKHGLSAGELPEKWNITKPEIITEVHKAYYDAGSNVVSTNTFGANPLKFPGDELEAIVKAAVENARQAAKLSDGTQNKWVALDIGPTGKLLAPYGDLEFDDAVALFAQTIRYGAKYGVDFIFIETMNDIHETKAALLAAKENCDLPVFVSNAYGEDGKLMTGASPAAVIAMLEGMGADAIGMNCSLGPAMLAPVAEEYLRYASVPVILKPNAGLPQVVDKQTVYTVLPDEFAREVAVLLEKGIRIVGGCCGTTPAHIAATLQAASTATPKMITPQNSTCISSYTHTVEFLDVPVAIGERIHTLRNEACMEAMESGDIDYVVSEGCDQQDMGTPVLHVHVGAPGVQEAETLPEAIMELQTIINLPLCIDATDVAALENALRCYKGKALIGPIAGKSETLSSVLPLVKKYGGAVIITLKNESDAPLTCDEQLNLAKEILTTAQAYGIARKDILFTPLSLADTSEVCAEEILRTVSLIRKEFGCHTVLTVTNVTFAPENAEMTCESFLHAAVDAGVSAVWINPYSSEYDNYAKTPMPL